MSRRLELRSLRCFAAVAEERSVRKAAERLHMTQPPLSRAIRALEALVGVPLFERRPAGMTLTEPGEVLARKAQKLLADADRLLEEVRARPAAPEVPRIGVGLGVPPAALKTLCAGWRKATGHATLEVRSDFSPRLANDLRAGRLDFALLALPGDVEGLETRRLAEQGLMAAIPAAHPAARKGRVRLLDLADLDLFWNARATNPAFHDACAAVFRRARFVPRYVTVPVGYLFTLDRIAAGQGFSLVNEWRARTRVPGLVYRAIVETERPVITLAAAWPAHARPPVLESLLKVARTLAR